MLYFQGGFKCGWGPELLLMRRTTKQDSPVRPTLVSQVVWFGEAVMTSAVLWRDWKHVNYTVGPTASDVCISLV